RALPSREQPRSYSLPLARADARRRDQRVEQPTVVVLLRVPLHADDELASGQLHRLDRAVQRPRGDGEAAAKPVNGLMVVAGYAHAAAEQPAGQRLGFQGDLDRTVLGRRGAVARVPDLVR